MTDSFSASSGRIVLSDLERVYAADGFSGTAITALSLTTGDLLWARNDLTSGQPPFLQAVASGLLIVNGQYHTVRAVDAATGDERWNLQLPVDYGAVGSVVHEGTLVVTAEAPREGDIRPPLVYSLDLTTGEVNWRSSLADGTDLQRHSPSSDGDVVVVASSLSHPDSASGNMVHAIDLSTGTVRWSVDLGGVQGFHHYPILIGNGVVVFAGPGPEVAAEFGQVVAVDLTSGQELWVRPQAWPLTLFGGESLIAASDVGMVALDATTGTETLILDTERLAARAINGVIKGGQLVTTTRTLLTGIDPATGEVLWVWEPPDIIVDLAALSDSHIAIPVASRSVSVIHVP